MSKKDQVRLGAEIGPNTRLVERRVGGRIAQGTLTPVRDGQPLTPGTELVKLTPGEDEWHDIETLYRHEQIEPALSGPPQVATPEYRKGYDRIFGKKPAVGLA